MIRARRQLVPMTLAEILIASTILLGVMAIALPAIMGQMRSSVVDIGVEEMRMEASLGKLYLQHDFATTSMQQILTTLDPDLTSVNGMAMPINAAIDAETGLFSWNQAAVYYLTTNADGTQALQRVVVSYSDFAANRVDSKVITDLQNGSWPDSKVLSKKTLVKRISDYNMACQTQSFNCYAPAYGKLSVFLGTVLLAPNATHTIRFECIGKDRQSGSYRVGVDRLYVSPTGTSLEPENLTVSAQDVSSSADLTLAGAAWGNSAVLKMPFPECTLQSRKGVTLEFPTDLWWDEDFDGASDPAKVVRIIDTAAGNDIVMAIDGGNTEAWNVISQTDKGLKTAYDVESKTVRVVLPGNQVAGFLPDATKSSGGHPKITFRSGYTWSYPLKISEAYIAEREGTTGFNASTDSAKRWTIRFNGSVSTSEFYGDLTSDPVSGMTFDKDKSYVVTFAVPSKSYGNYRATERDQHENDPYPLTKIVVGNYATTADWSSLSGDTPTSIIGIKAVIVSYPCAASFLSTVLDTKEVTTNPTLGTLTVTKKDVTNAAIAITWRSGTTPDFSVAGEDTWYTSVAALPPKRYIQYKANFTTTQPITSSPYLREVKLPWTPSVTRSVDLGADVAVGPDFGMFQVKVDGSAPLMAYVRLWFNLKRTILGGEYNAPLIVEVNPRNP